MLKRALSLLALTSAVLATSTVHAEKLVVDRIAGVVDNAIILQSELDALTEQVNQAQPIPAGVDAAAAKKQRCEQVLDTLVAEKLLESEVKKLRIEVTDAEVERVVQGTMRDNNLNEEQLKQALSRQNMTLPDY
ncbi:MAG TPA: SurA N-terminal domain-containing protein, partial [Myxococcota bacterium]